MNIISSYRKIPLLRKLLFAMVLGLIAGAILGEKILKVQFLGTLFLNLLKMCCIPLVLVNLISGISSLTDPKMFGRVGAKIVLYYFGTTIVAAIIGVIGGGFFRPGDGLILTESYEGTLANVPGVMETILNMVPSNIFDALSAGNLDKVVVFAAFAGVAVLMCEPEDRRRLNTMFSSLANMFNKLVKIVMGYAPIGVFSLIGCVVGQYGKAMVGSALRYIIAVAVCMFVQWCLYFVILFFTTGRLPKGFLRKTFNLVATTISTSSSMAAIPVNMECAKDLDCDKSIYSFTIPLGAQLNKDGQAIMLTLSLLFAAQAAGVTLSAATLFNAIVIALLLTTGSGGIPGGGLVTIAIIIDAFAMPVDVVAIISGVFFLVDLLNTTMNCYGDLIGTYIVDRSEKKRKKKLNLSSIA